MILCLEIEIDVIEDENINRKSIEEKLRILEVTINEKINKGKSEKRMKTIEYMCKKQREIWKIMENKKVFKELF